MWFKIVNSGEIETGALILLGASTKDGQTTIGRFGSGNKYAIACLLREGIDLRIFSGEREISITTDDLQFRGQSFKNIRIDGERTSLTTKTGPDWQPWMACREFLCNAIDEGGESWSCIEEEPAGTSGTTSVYVSAADGRVADFAENLDDYLYSGKVLAEGIIAGDYAGRVSILPNVENRIFRKHICAGTLTRPLFSYDLENVPINESRLVQSEYLTKEPIAWALASCVNKEVIQKLLETFHHNMPCFEADLYWSSAYIGVDRFSSTWHDVIKELGWLMTTHGIWETRPPEDREGLLPLPENLLEALCDAFPDLPVFGDISRGIVAAEPSAALAKAISAAKATLKSFGMPVTCPIEYALFAQDSTQAVFCKDDTGERIIISAVMDPALALRALMEEVLHQLSGSSDGSRSFEDALINRLITAEQRALAAEGQLKAIRTAVRKARR